MKVDFSYFIYFFLKKKLWFSPQNFHLAKYDKGVRKVILTNRNVVPRNLKTAVLPICHSSYIKEEKKKSFGASFLFQNITIYREKNDKSVVKCT